MLILSVSEFLALFPDDNNRVVLAQGSNDDNDYINASYISVIKCHGSSYSYRYWRIEIKPEVVKLVLDNRLLNILEKWRDESFLHCYPRYD